MVAGGFKQATIDADQVKKWWTDKPTANIGISLDPSGICVVDVDTHGDVNGFESLPMLGDMPETAIARTPSGGAHYVFTNEGKPPARKVGLVEGIDLLANGYIVAAPSVIDGKAYRWEAGGNGIASFPQQVRDMAAYVPAPAVNTQPTCKPIAVQDRTRTLHRASLWLQKAEEAVEGQAGHSKLLWAAQGLVNGFMLNRADALSLLWSEYNPRCAPSWDQGNASHAKDFERKVDQAIASPVKAPGWLLGDDAPYVPEPWIVSFTEALASGATIEAVQQGTEETSEELPMVDQPSVDSLLESMVASTPDRIAELRLRAQDAVFVLPQMALAGELTILNAQYNTGKTLITLWLLKNRDMEATKHLDIYYINADDSFNGGIEKMALTESFGVKTLIPNQFGFSIPVFFEILQQAIEKGTASNKVFVLDTLKKFVSTMDKKNAAKFNNMARTFTQAGGTLIALAHTNKNKDADGKSVAEGVGDFHSDFDTAYTIEKSAVLAEAVTDRTIVFENAKMRGPVSQKVTFSYHAGEGRTWEQRFNSIKRLSPGDAVAAEENARAMAQQGKDQTIISFIFGELSDGPKSHTHLIKEKPSNQTGLPTGSRAEREKVLDRYGPANNREAMRWWLTSKGQNGGLDYYIDKQCDARTSGHHVPWQ